VTLYHLAPGFGGARNHSTSPATYFTYRDNARVFEEIGLWYPRRVHQSNGGRNKSRH